MPSKGKEPKKDLTVSLREQGCTVYYEKSVTKNLGNYESAKVTVGVTLPIQPSEGEIAHVKSTIEIADEIVTEELQVQLKEITKA